MATKPEARGRGAGTKVLQALVEHATAHGATRLWCNARTRALPVYERAGFKATSGEFDDAARSALTTGWSCERA